MVPLSGVRLIDAKRINPYPLGILFSKLLICCQVRDAEIASAEVP
jgi:hypothetical protein